MKIQMPQMTLRCIKKTLSRNCCMICLENDITMVVITQPLLHYIITLHFYITLFQMCLWKQSVLLLEREEQKKNPQTNRQMWAGFEEKSLLMENSSGYRMINDFSLPPDICLSLALQRNLGSRKEQGKLSVWSLGKGQEELKGDLQCLLSPPDMLALKLKQTSTDTNGVWSATVYKIKGAKYKTLFAVI